VVYGSIRATLTGGSGVDASEPFTGPCRWRTQAGFHPICKGPIPLRSTLLPETVESV
jgi:hypothetical protein